MKEFEGMREHLALLNQKYPGKSAFSAKELAEYLGMDVSVTSRLIREGKLPGKRIGRVYRTTFMQLARWECAQD